jgi:hypothetical protein
MCLFTLPAAFGQQEGDVDVDALRPFVKTLNRDVDLYHCTSGSVTARPVLDEYLREKLSRYWNSAIPVRPHATVSGLYAGVEPVTCRHFGGVGNDWTIIRIRLPAGSAVLDVRQEQPPGVRPRLSNAFRDLLKKLDCAAPDPSSLVIGLSSMGCRSIALRLMSKLSIQAILTDFPTFVFENCDPGRTGVFIMLDRASLKDVAGFGVNLPDGLAAPTEMLMIRELYAFAQRAGSLRELPWPSMRGSPGDPIVKQWMNDHLWSCGTSAFE